MRFKPTRGANLLRLSSISFILCITVLILRSQRRLWTYPTGDDAITALLDLPLVGSETDFQLDVDAPSSAFLNRTRGSVSSDEGNCDRILLYASDIITNDTGVGHRTSFYVLASVLAVFTDSALVILDPPSDGQWSNVGGSPFGCPIKNSDKDCNSLPTGLGRIIRVPEWLSRGCTVPCSHTHTYDDWVEIANKTTRRSNFAPTVCADNKDHMAQKNMSNKSDENHQGKNVTVLAIGKFHMRNFWMDYKRSEFIFGRLPRNQNKAPQLTTWDKRVTRWSKRMGASEEDVQKFLMNQTSMMEYLSALITKAGIIEYQPWVINDVHQSLSKVTELQNLSAQSPPQLLRSSRITGYDAMHIRRGDRIHTSDTMEEVEKYWVQQGYPPVNISANHESIDTRSDIISASYPTNYLPFAHYWHKYKSSNCTNHGQTADLRKQSLTRYVYIATDDIETVRAEIANLTSSQGSEYWVHCDRRIEFVFYPQDLAKYTKHLHVSNQVGVRHDEVLHDEAHEQYHRAISAIADLHILSQSDVLFGEVRSYWGRLLQTLRTSFQHHLPYTKDFHIVLGAAGRAMPW